MITKLKQQSRAVASQIYQVFQASYKLEAELLAVKRFPPLSRSIENIQGSDSCFIGFHQDNDLIAVIEITFKDGCLDIDSLTVHPSCFGQGVASQLIQHVLTRFEYKQAMVETAVDNLPAIKLYKKHGFAETKRWTPEHGIEKLAMRINKGSL